MTTPLTPEEEDLLQALVTLRHTLTAERLPGRRVVLRHATPRHNLPSILQDGLLLHYATGRLPAVWWHRPSLSVWAIDHTRRRHGERDIALLTMALPRRNVVRFRRGIWFTSEDIPPALIVDVA